MAKKKRYPRKLLALTPEKKGRSNPHVGEVFEHTFCPEGGKGDRNLNEPIFKIFNG